MLRIMDEFGVDLTDESQWPFSYEGRQMASEAQLADYGVGNVEPCIVQVSHPRVTASPDKKGKKRKIQEVEEQETSSRRLAVAAAPTPARPRKKGKPVVDNLRGGNPTTTTTMTTTTSRVTRSGSVYGMQPSQASQSGGKGRGRSLANGSSEMRQENAVPRTAVQMKMEPNLASQPLVRLQYFSMVSQRQTYLLSNIVCPGLV